MRWLIEGGGDGHDIHLQVPIVLRSIFHVQLKTRFRSCIDLVPGSFTSSCESHSSPGLCIPTPPLHPQIIFFSLFQPSFQPDSVPVSLPGHISPTRGKEQKERPWKLGWTSWHLLATCLPWRRLRWTWTDYKNTPWGTREHLWIILPPFSLRKLCSLCPLAPSFFYYTLM